MIAIIFTSKRKKKKYPLDDDCINNNSFQLVD